jgi:hypothetical protein
MVASPTHACTAAERGLAKATQAGFEYVFRSGLAAADGFRIVSLGIGAR